MSLVHYSAKSSSSTKDLKQGSYDYKILLAGKDLCPFLIEDTMKQKKGLGPALLSA